MQMTLQIKAQVNEYLSAHIRRRRYERIVLFFAFFVSRSVNDISESFLCADEIGKPDFT